MVAFRGTNGANLDNWRSNLNVLSSPYPGVTGAKVHSGFLSAYNDVKDQVKKAITAQLGKYPNAEIFVTGHSLGGALALLAAVDIKNSISPNKKVTLYTYG